MGSLARIRQMARLVVLQPLLAAATVGLVLCAPIVILGNISDATTRDGARQQVLQQGATVAQAASNGILQRLEALSDDVSQFASGELRRALRERTADVAGRLMPEMSGVTGPVRPLRARITDTQGNVLVESYPPFVVTPNSATTGLVDERARSASARTGQASIRTERFIFAPAREGIKGRTQATMAIGWSVHDVIELPDGSLRRPPLGFVVLDLDFDFLSYTLAPLRDSASDVYLLDDAGRFVAQAGDPLSGEDLLRDLSTSDIFKDVQRSIPGSVEITRTTIPG